MMRELLPYLALATALVAASFFCARRSLRILAFFVASLGVIAALLAREPGPTVRAMVFFGLFGLFVLMSRFELSIAPRLKRPNHRNK